jgi:plastocyanin
MNKNGVIITIVVIVLAVIGIIVFAMNSNNQPAPANSQSQSDQNVPISAATPTGQALPVNYSVSYTDQGFSPATVTINNGDSVTWTNNSTNRMWVASDPHPTHTDLPGFDEKTAVAAGGSWTYTFIVSGSHGYHNHTNPSIKGTVVVQ